MSFGKRLRWLFLYVVFFITQTDRAESQFIDFETDELGWVFDQPLSPTEAFRFTFGDPIRQTWAGPGWYGDTGDYIGYISDEVACTVRGAQWCDQLSDYRQYLKAGVF